MAIALYMDENVPRQILLGIIYAAQQIASIGVCVWDLELIAKVSDLEDFANHIQYLPL